MSLVLQCVLSLLQAALFLFNTFKKVSKGANHVIERDLFHVYLNRLEVHFLWLHINKTKNNKFAHS